MEKSAPFVVTGQWGDFYSSLPLPSTEDNR